MTPQFTRIDTGQVQLRAAVVGQGPLVLFVHGFPESWYSWRHQLGPVAAAGFQAVAIDVRGYGGSDKPDAIEAYDLEALTEDIAGVITALGQGSAILVGHDWGAPQVWTTALTRPELVRAVAGLSIPHLGVPTVPFIDLIDQLFTARGKFFYQAYFQAPGVAEAELEADVAGGLHRFLYAISGDAPDGTWPKDKPHGARLLDGLPDPDPFPAWLTPADLAYYVEEFTGSGFRGPLNRYRNHHRDFAWLQPFNDRKITAPALFIGGSRDLALKMLPGFDPVEASRAHFTDLRGAHLLDGCGHWTQQEQPEAVNALLLDWLAGV